MHTEKTMAVFRKMRLTSILTTGWLATFFFLFLPGFVSAAGLSERDLDIFRNHFAVLEGGGPIDSVLDRSSWPNNEGLASYLELELLLHPRHGATLPRLLGFLDRWPNHAQKKRLEKMVEVRIIDTTHEGDALAWFDRHPPVTKPARAYYLQLLLSKKRFSEAQPLWKTLYLEGMIFSDNVKDKTADFEKQITVADREGRARSLVGKGSHKALLDLLQSLPKDRRDYFLALDAATSGDKKLFNQLRGRLQKKDATSPELWYVRIEWLRNQGSLSKAREMVMGPEGHYLNANDRCAIRYRLAQYYYNQDQLKDAFELLDLNVKEKGAELEDSLWLAAWTAHRLKNDKRALELFKLLGKDAKTDHRRSQGAWWAAELSNSEEAKRMWINHAAQSPDSFYGLIAIETRDGRLPELIDPPLKCDAIKDPRVQGDLQRMRWLREVGRNFYNGPEVDNLGQLYNLGMEDRLCLAINTSAYDHAIQLAREMKKGGHLHWQGLYPLPHWRPGWGWQLEPALIWGIARQESTFLPRAQSGAQARGLLQLMPATAEEQARKSSLPPYNPNRLHDPAYNLALGQAYMKRMLSAFDGDLVLALCSYNAGPGRGKKWSDRRRVESALTFIENIPFVETRSYVKLVINGVVHYQLRLHGKGSILNLIGEGEPGPGKFFM